MISYKHKMKNTWRRCNPMMTITLKMTNNIRVKSRMSRINLRQRSVKRNLVKRRKLKHHLPPNWGKVHHKSKQSTFKSYFAIIKEVEHCMIVHFNLLIPLWPRNWTLTISEEGIKVLPDPQPGEPLRRRKKSSMKQELPVLWRQRRPGLNWIHSSWTREYLMSAVMTMHQN